MPKLDASAFVALWAISYIWMLFLEEVSVIPAEKASTELHKEQEPTESITDLENQAPSVAS